MFKIGDKVRLVNHHPSRGMGTCKVGDIGTIKGIGIKDCLIVDFPSQRDWFAEEEDLELVQEEQSMKLKQNWSIRVHSKEQAKVYEKTLISLGYILTDDEKLCLWEDYKHLRNGMKDLWYSDFTEKQHFDNLESFLTWHFQEEETEQQKQIRELEETIAKAQQQIEQLKKQI